MTRMRKFGRRFVDQGRAHLKAPIGGKNPHLGEARANAAGTTGLLTVEQEKKGP